LEIFQHAMILNTCGTRCAISNLRCSCTSIAGRETLYWWPCNGSW